MHETKDGTCVAISKMTDSHLLNTIRYFQRKAKDGVVVWCGGSGFSGDEMWFDEGIVYNEEALRHLNIEYYLIEARKRGLGGVKDD